MPETPTPRQQQVLDFIRGYCCAHDRPPTIREIGGHMGIRSPNGVMCHLKAMLRKRLIEHEPLTARSLRVVTGEPAPDLPTVVAMGGQIVLGVGSGIIALTCDQAVKLACELMKQARQLRGEAVEGGHP